MINDVDLTHWNKIKKNKKNCSLVTKNAFKILVGNIGFSLSLQDLNMGMEI